MALFNFAESIIVLQFAVCGQSQLHEDLLWLGDYNETKPD